MRTVDVPFRHAFTSHRWRALALLGLGACHAVLDLDDVEFRDDTSAPATGTAGNAGTTSASGGGTGGSGGSGGTGASSADWCSGYCAGTCENNECIVADGEVSPLDVVEDGFGNVLWEGFGSPGAFPKGPKEIRRCSKVGCQSDPEVLANGLNSASDLTLVQNASGSRILFNDGGVVKSCPNAATCGGEPTPVHAGAAHFIYDAVSDTLFVADPVNGIIRFSAAPDAPKTNIGGVGAQRLGLDGDTLYYSTLSGEVFRCDVDDCNAPEPIATLAPGVVHLCVDGDAFAIEARTAAHVNGRVVNLTTSFSYDLRGLDPYGSPFNNTYASRCALDSENLYFTNVSGLHVAPRDGSPAYRVSPKPNPNYGFGVKLGLNPLDHVIYYARSGDDPGRSNGKIVAHYAP